MRHYAVCSIVLFFATFFVLDGPQPAIAQNRITPPDVEWQASGSADQRYLQRSLEIYEFKRAAASGLERGREIFYYKCWMCHNEFAKEAPRLTGLFQRPTLVSGEPVREESVKAQIRNGSENMAAYKYVLSDADIDDLYQFIKNDCCWNSDAPPKNPRYIAR